MSRLWDGFSKRPAATPATRPRAETATACAPGPPTATRPGDPRAPLRDRERPARDLADQARGPARQLRILDGAGTAYFRVHEGRDVEHAAEVRELIEELATDEDADRSWPRPTRPLPRQLAPARRRLSDSPPHRRDPTVPSAHVQGAHCGDRPGHPPGHRHRRHLRVRVQRGRDRLRLPRRRVLPQRDCAAQAQEAAEAAAARRGRSRSR